MSDHFAFATFFPEILQPVVGLVASLVHSMLVKVRLCRKTVKRYDVGAPSSITISLPGTDPQDAERRRYPLPSPALPCPAQPMRVVFRDREGTV